jgi:hypothetical protein
VDRERRRIHQPAGAATMERTGRTRIICDQHLDVVMGVEKR